MKNLEMAYTIHELTEIERMEVNAETGLWYDYVITMEFCGKVKNVYKYHDDTEGPCVGY